MANCNHIVAVVASLSGTIFHPIGQDLVFTASYSDDGGALPCAQRMKWSWYPADETVTYFHEVDGSMADTEYSATWTPPGMGTYTVRVQGLYSPTGYPHAPTETVEDLFVVNVVERHEVDLCYRGGLGVGLPERSSTVGLSERSHIVGLPERSESVEIP